MIFYLISMLVCANLSAVATFFVRFLWVSCQVRSESVRQMVQFIITSGPSFIELTLELQYLQSKYRSKLNLKIKQLLKRKKMPEIPYLNTIPNKLN